jgi:hypothetical protein
MDEPYVARFSIGTRVRIADRAALAKFRAKWRHHNPLTPEQLAFAGREALVKDIGYYHGGDVLYTLEDVSGVWHEACLVSADYRESDDSSR